MRIYTRLDQTPCDPTLQYLKPQKVDFEPRYKKKGRSKATKLEQRKQGVQYEHKQKQIREFAHRTEQESKKQKAEKTADKGDTPYNVFERFKKKST